MLNQAARRQLIYTSLTVLVLLLASVGVAMHSAMAGYSAAGPSLRSSANNYWLVASDGGIFSIRDAGFYGSAGGLPLHRPIVGMAATPDGGGYWLVASDGGIFSFGDAKFLGSTGSLSLNQPIVGMAATPDGEGYWLVASDGGIFSIGDAGFYGSAGGLPLHRPIVGMAATPDGGGYWLVASDGGIFSFGDAKFLGSTGSLSLKQPIVGMAATPDGEGYWLVASDGGIFSIGDAGFYGSAGGLPLHRPIVGMAATPDGGGYWLVASDGGIFSFGDAKYRGSTGSLSLKQPIVGMAAIVTHTDPGPPGPVVGGAPPATGPVVTGAPSVNGPQGDPGSWSLNFSSTFGTGSSDLSKWSPCYPWYHPCDQGTNFGHPELEWYIPSQVKESGSFLQLTASHRPTPGYTAGKPAPGYTAVGQPTTYPWASGMITTHDAFNFTYGFVQVVARVPKGSGFFPALWLLPSNLSWPPEIDIMETWGSNPYRVVFTNHTKEMRQLPQFQIKLDTPDITTSFHTYGVDWEPDSITWYLDGKAVGTDTTGVPSQPMYLLANLAIDGEPGFAPNASTPPSGSFDIKAVDIWQH